MGRNPLIVLDTATWIWLTSDPDQLSEAARETIDAHPGRMVSTISAWEVGMLVAKSRIRLDRPVDRWTDEAIRSNGVESVPIDQHIGTLATMLAGDPPGDPADRMIIATTLRRGGLLVTPDRQIRDYPFCPTVW
jgi:PIN domain nuclease of toxin-antitoxin system